MKGKALQDVGKHLLSTLLVKEMQVSEPTFLGLLASKFLSPRAQERLGPCAQASQSTKVISEHTG